MYVHSILVSTNDVNEFVYLCGMEQRHQEQVAMILRQAIKHFDEMRQETAPQEVFV